MRQQKTLGPAHYPGPTASAVQPRGFNALEFERVSREGIDTARGMALGEIRRLEEANEQLRFEVLKTERRLTRLLEDLREALLVPVHERHAFDDAQAAKRLAGLAQRLKWIETTEAS